MLAKEIWEVIVTNCRGQMGSNTAIGQMERGANDAANVLAKQFDEDLATAQAQVAVMAAALNEWLRYTDPNAPWNPGVYWADQEAWKEAASKGEHVPPKSMLRIREQARDAFSAAPKVLWSGKAEIRHKQSGIAGGTWGAPYTTLRLLHEAGHVSKHGQWNLVVVLDKQGEGE